jgi:hypothetical protein
MQGFSIALGNGGKFLKKQQQFYFKKTPINQLKIKNQGTNTDKEIGACNH